MQVLGHTVFSSVQFCSSYYSSEEVELFIAHWAYSTTTSIIPRVEIRQENLSIDRVGKHFLEFCRNVKKWYVIHAPAMILCNFDGNVDQAFNNWCLRTRRRLAYVL